MSSYESCAPDFYREMGDLFSVELRPALGNQLELADELRGLAERAHACAAKAGATLQVRLLGAHHVVAPVGTRSDAIIRSIRRRAHTPPASTLRS